jgi:hypothetical protein
MNGPDPDAVAWLEDPDRLAHQRALEPDGPHVCDDQCRPALANPIAASAFGVAIAAAAQHESETAARTTQEAPNGVACLDELLRVAITPARRRRWWWPW